MRETGTLLPSLPPRATRIRSRLWPWLARGLLRLSGWRLVGELPDVSKLVVVGAPHSSYWDGVLGLLMKVGIGIMIKREVLDGPLGNVLRPLGAVAIDRGAATGVVPQMARRPANSERMWLGITPEGTRKPVKRWKSGFIRIAREAYVPLLPVYFSTTRPSASCSARR